MFQLHALSSALKAASFNDSLKFSQSNRLCCGGHGYSYASGIPQIIAEIDAGCTYEGKFNIIKYITSELVQGILSLGDNVILLLQTARYLLKCAQNNISPHFDLPNSDELHSSPLFSYLKRYYEIFNRLYEE